MSILVIGDCHAKIAAYFSIVKDYDRTIQVGDFGFAPAHNWHLNTLDPTKHKVNFGNHDDPAFLKSPHSCGDFSFFGDIMTIRGAYSIDKAWRIEGFSWWTEEEMNYEEMQKCIDVYLEAKPRVIVSHDCPETTRKIMFNIQNKTKTSTGLEHMFSMHQPKLWIFGHHHVSRDVVINKTRFICLNELEPFLI